MADCSDDEFPDIDVDALLASTGVAALVAQHGPATADVEHILQAAALPAPGEDTDGDGAELTAEDLNDEGLLSDLSAIGWEEEPREAPPPVLPSRPAPQPAAAPRAAARAQDDSALEAQILALADEGADARADAPRNRHGMGIPAPSGERRGTPAAAAAAVGAEEVDARIAECLRNALACKQAGDRQGALAWLGSKKALAAVRAEAEAGLLARAALPPRPDTAAAADALAPPGGGVRLPAAEAALAPPAAAAAAQQCAAPRGPAGSGGGAPAQPRAPPAPPATAGAPPPAQPQPQPPPQPPPPPQQQQQQQPQRQGGAAPLRALGADEIEVSILAARLIPARLPSPAPHTHGAYRLSLPGIGAAEQEGRTPTVRASAEPAYAASFVLRFDRRKAATATAFAHRRLSVEVWAVAHTGLLRFLTAGPALLGRADLKLAPLLREPQLDAALQLRAPEGGDSPGQVSVRVRLSAPILQAAPPPQPPPAAGAPPTRSAAEAAGGGRRAARAQAEPGAAAAPSAPSAPSSAGAAAAGAGARASGRAAGAAPSAAAAAAAEGAEEAEDDFAYAERIASFDVLTWEIEQVSARQGPYARASAEALRLRREALEFRKQLIELKVGAGQLTMEEYLAQLRTAIAAEQRLAVAHKGSEGIEGKQRAVHCLRRVKLMRDELLTALTAQAADAQAGGDADADGGAGA